LLRRIVASLIVVLLFLSLSVFTFSVQPARAQSGAIYINADGSVSPSTAPITSVDNITYTFTGNTNESVVVQRNNIVVDGAGYTIQGTAAPYSIGINLTGRSNVTIKNVKIKAFYYGLILDHSSNSIFSGSSITNNTTYGIYLFYSSNDTVSGNNITNDNYGVYLDSSSNSTILRNNITNNAQCGVLLYDSSNHNTVSGNNITNTKYYGAVDLDLGSDYNTVSGNVFTNDGLIVVESFSNVVEGNLVNGKPLVYLEDISDYAVSEEAGQVVLVDCRSMVVDNLNLSRAEVGVELLRTNDTRITNNTMAHNEFGVYIDDFCNGDTVSGNNITNNDDGVYLGTFCDNDTVSGNNLTNNYAGVGLDLRCSNNIVSRNNVTTNKYGVWLGTSCSYVTVSENDIADNGYGVYISSSSNDTFFHNNLVDNAQQVGRQWPSTNAWDEGYPSGGNYWSDYLTKYPNAAENDSSGIWNTPYVIGTNNTDRYPLMAPCHTFDAGTWNGVAYSVDTVSNSTLSNFSFNATAKTLTFNVTGTNGTMSFCRVAIPLSLMSCANLKDWIVTVNGTQLRPPNLNITTDANYTYIYFTYHHSTETAQIQSTTAVPEFTPFMLLPLFMIITLLGAIILRRKRGLKNARATLSAENASHSTRARALS
jgi:parallel beta-helix repeat protein